MMVTNKRKKFIHLLHSHLLVLQLTHLFLPVSLETFLDEPQEVLVVHAGGCVDVSVDLPHVVEVSVGNFFLCR